MFTTTNIVLALAAARAALATGVSVTPHDSYSSSVGVLGCYIDTNRVAYWPGSVDCNNLCVKLTNGDRSVYLLRIDQSGGAHDISYDAWNYLQTGESATVDPMSGGGVAMEYEEVDASQCASLIHTDGNKLPLSASNSMDFVASCLASDSWVGKNHVLYNIADPLCSLGYDETCTLDLSVSNQPSCPHTLGLTTSLTTTHVYNVEYPSGKCVDASTGVEVSASVAFASDSGDDTSSGSSSGSSGSSAAAAAAKAPVAAVSSSTTVAAAATTTSSTVTPAAPTTTSSSSSSSTSTTAPAHSPGVFVATSQSAGNRQQVSSQSAVSSSSSASTSSTTTDTITMTRTRTSTVPCSTSSVPASSSSSVPAPSSSAVPAPSSSSVSAPPSSPSSSSVPASSSSSVPASSSSFVPASSSVSAPSSSPSSSSEPSLTASQTTTTSTSSSSSSSTAASSSAPATTFSKSTLVLAPSSTASAIGTGSIRPSTSATGSSATTSPSTVVVSGASVGAVSARAVAALSGVVAVMMLL